MIGKKASLDSLKEMVGSLPLPAKVFAEQICWALAYLVLIEIALKSVIRWLFPVLFPKVWKKLGEEKGSFCSNEQGRFKICLYLSDSIQDANMFLFEKGEVVLLAGIGTQHIFAGSLVLFGTLTTGRVDLVRHGMLCESGWEMLDASFLLLNAGPCEFYLYP